MKVETQDDGQLSVSGCIGHYGHDPEEDRAGRSSLQPAQVELEQAEGEAEGTTNDDNEEEQESVQLFAPIPPTPASGLRDPSASASTSEASTTRLQYVPAPSASTEFSNTPLTGPERLRLIKACKKIKATADNYLGENSYRAMVRMETLVQVIGTFD